jgi:hypothetical protein
VGNVSRERARELVIRHIDQDPSLESLSELYEMDLAKPELDIINVAGMTCVGVPMGTPEFVNAFVRSKAHDIVHVNFDHGRGDGGSFFQELVLFMSRFSYSISLYRPFFNAAWETPSAPSLRRNWHGAA